MTVLDQMKSFLEEDKQSLIEAFKAKYNMDVTVESVDMEDSVDGDEVTLEVTLHCKSNDSTFDIEWEYTSEGEDIYMSESIDQLVEGMKMRYDESENIVSASAVVGSSIMAAEGDESEDDFESDNFGGNETESNDSDGLEDTIDNLADNVEDVQDQIDEVQEDDVNIELENNIEGHYIAECERCHGIFISSVTESDQVVESIKGTCPICERETDQYLKWVVKKVEQ